MTKGLRWGWPWTAATGAAAVLVLAAVVGAGSPSSAPHAADAGAGRFVWHELMTEDLARSQAFYGQLFDWTFQTVRETEPAFVAIKHRNEYVGGMVAVKRSDPAVPVSQWLSYIAVSDPDATVSQARAAGGKVLREPFDAAGIARAAVIADPQGALVGFARFNKGIPDREPVPGGWLWMEHVAQDPDGALRFYGDVVGYTSELAPDQANLVYHVLRSDKPRAGLFKSPWEQVRANWLPYIQVADPGLAAARAEQLGGKIVLQPNPDVRKGTLAIITDPTGAAMALQKFPIS